MRFANAEDLVHRRYMETGENDRYGNPISDWVTLPEPFRAGVADKAIEIQFSPGRADMDFDFALYAEPGQNVGASDLLVVRGLDCKIVKPHFEWNGLFTKWRPGSTVYVKAEVS